MKYNTSPVCLINNDLNKNVSFIGKMLKRAYPERKDSFYQQIAKVAG